jgi:hypothetical protein
MEIKILDYFVIEEDIILQLSKHAKEVIACVSST